MAREAAGGPVSIFVPQVCGTVDQGWPIP